MIDTPEAVAATHVVDSKIWHGVTVADVTTYLAYLKHKHADSDNSNYMRYRRHEPDSKPKGEPNVSEQVKETALAIVDGLGGTEFFAARRAENWLFHGYAPLTKQRQTACTRYFFANKDNFLALINDIVHTRHRGRAGDLAYWLVGVTTWYDFEDKLVASFNAVKAADDYISIKGGRSEIKNEAEPMHDGVTFYGHLIANMLYQMLYVIEEKYQETYQSGNIWG